MEDLLLKDFAPRPTIVTRDTLVEQPKFPAIDAHNHLGFVTDSFGEAVNGEGTGCLGDLGELVGIMDQCGVKAMANLTGRWGSDLKRLIDKFEGGHPGRFYTFCNVDWSRATEPGFGEQAAAQLEESISAGARGLKLFKNLGLRVKDASGKLMLPDDERLAPLWAKAGELGVPVLIHVADPPAFFEPLDRFNPAYLALQRRPEWHFHGPPYLTFRELIEAGIRLMAQHPGTTFITAHAGWYSENLQFVAEQMLDRLPNMYTDFSARISTLGLQPHSARRFFIKYQDRILFGTDMSPSVEVYRTFYRFLETWDDQFEASPGRSTSRICGISLPDEVLEKVYHKNAERLIPGLR